MAENEDDLHSRLHQFNTAAIQYNMIISTEETETLAIPKEPIRSTLTIEDKTIEQIMEVDYLGIKLFSHGKIEE